VEGPTFVASVGTMEADDRLHTLTSDVLEGEIHTRDVSTDARDIADRSTLVASADSEYRTLLVSHYEPQGCFITALAVFLLVPGRTFTHPGESVSLSSRIVQELDDHVGVLVTDD
jgi:hypothetical protein